MEQLFKENSKSKSPFCYAFEHFEEKKFLEFINVFDINQVESEVYLLENGYKAQEIEQKIFPVLKIPLKNNLDNKSNISEKIMSNNQNIFFKRAKSFPNLKLLDDSLFQEENTRDLFFKNKSKSNLELLKKQLFLEENMQIENKRNSNK